MRLLHLLPKRVRFLVVVCSIAGLIVSIGLSLNVGIDSLHVSLSSTSVPFSNSGSTIHPNHGSKSALPAKQNISQSEKALKKSPPTSSGTPQIILPLQIPPSAKPKTGAEPLKPVKAYFGHLPYQEAEQSRLVSVGHFVRGTYERLELLDMEVSQAFQGMADAAKEEGVTLMPISGFRSIADQHSLFTQQIQRQESEEAAARLSAPSGYSEHHTGYALDIADVQRSDTDLKLGFQETKAYRWLTENAYKYGFEQSFPENNWQGVSFEPWHWRYVLSPRAAQVFAVAKSSS
jgi:zinc D-Ala-D-Ala carboxypeptidase